MNTSLPDPKRILQAYLSYKIDPPKNHMFFTHLWKYIVFFTEKIFINKLPKF